MEQYEERYEANGRNSTKKKCRIVENTPVFAAMSNFGPCERFCVLPDKRIGIVLNPNFVLGYKDGLVLVPKSDDEHALVFPEFEPTIPDGREFPLLTEDGEGVRLSGRNNQ